MTSMSVEVIFIFVSSLIMLMLLVVLAVILAKRWIVIIKGSRTRRGMKQILYMAKP